MRDNNFKRKIIEIIEKENNNLKVIFDACDSRGAIVCDARE